MVSLFLVTLTKITHEGFGKGSFCKIHAGARLFRAKRHCHALAPALVHRPRSQKKSGTGHRDAVTFTPFVGLFFKYFSGTRKKIWRVYTRTKRNELGTPIFLYGLGKAWRRFCNGLHQKKFLLQRRLYFFYGSGASPLPSASAAKSRGTSSRKNESMLPFVWPT